MKIGNTTIGKIFNVCTRDNDDSCFFCKVEFIENDNTETVNYVARKSDSALTGKYIYQQIVDGKFEGQISDVGLDIDPWTKEVIPDRTEELVKMERDMRISVTDWTQMADVAEETKQKWATYRQALRDITTQPGYPQNVVWPAAPQ